MSVEVKEITNDFDKDEVVYCVIDIDSGTVIGKGIIPPSKTIPIQYDSLKTTIVLVYKKYDPEYCGIITLS